MSVYVFLTHLELIQSLPYEESSSHKRAAVAQWYIIIGRLAVQSQLNLYECIISGRRGHRSDHDVSLCVFVEQKSVCVSRVWSLVTAGTFGSVLTDLPADSELH